MNCSGVLPATGNAGGGALLAAGMIVVGFGLVLLARRHAAIVGVITLMVGATLIVSVPAPAEAAAPCASATTTSTVAGGLPTTSTTAPTTTTSAPTTTTTTTTTTTCAPAAHIPNVIAVGEWTNAGILADPWTFDDPSIVATIEQIRAANGGSLPAASATLKHWMSDPSQLHEATTAVDSWWNGAQVEVSGMDLLGVGAHDSTPDGGLYEYWLRWQVAQVGAVDPTWTWDFYLYVTDNLDSTDPDMINTHIPTWSTINVAAVQMAVSAIWTELRLESTVTLNDGCADYNWSIVVSSPVEAGGGFST